MSRIRAVVFDVGETLVDETRHWGEWADWLGVPRFTFFAAFGAVIERGWHHRRVFELVRPDIDLAAEQARRAAAGWRYTLEPGDFYPDALPCLAELRAAGFKVGVVGNQPEAAETSLAAMSLEADFIASSARWGVEKPDTAFFGRAAEPAGEPADAVAYVGDHPHNDIAGAKAAGMTAVHIRRGPWAIAHGHSTAAAQADLRIETLQGLASLLTSLG